MQNSQVFMKTNLFKSLLLTTLILAMASTALSKNENAHQQQGPRNECDPRDPVLADVLKGMVLRNRTGKYIDLLVQKERALKGYEPKVFIVGRAGQNLSGVMVLRDLDRSGRVISVKDMFDEVLGKGHQVPSQNGQTTEDTQQANAAQYRIKKLFKDANRTPLIYSHLGILVLDHSIKTVPHEFRELDDDGNPITTTLEGDFFIDELLKPCGSTADAMIPRSWITGLTTFYQDDPHEYRTILMVPTPEIQDAILSIVDEKGPHGVRLRSDRENYKLFLGKNYNAAAAYTDLVDQNSNQYVLEVIAAAHMKVNTGKLNGETTRADILNYLKATQYRPTKIVADSMKMNFATSVFAPKTLNIKNEDNPYARPFVVTEFVTELSVREYMQRLGVLNNDDIHGIVVTEDEVLQDAEIKVITEEQRRRLVQKSGGVSKVKEKKK